MRRTVTFNIAGQAMATIMVSALYESPELYDTSEDTRVASQALRRAEYGKRGRGETYQVTTTPVAATVIMEYCETVGQKLVQQVETQRDGRALLVVADRIMWRLRELVRPDLHCLRCKKDLSTEVAVTAFARHGHRFLPITGALLCMECGANGANTLTPEEVQTASSRL